MHNMYKTPTAHIVLAVLAVISPLQAAADDKKPTPIPIAKLERDIPIDFQKEILPFLRKNCLACHNRTKARGDVILETPRDIRAGVDGDPLIVPGKSEESLLLAVSAHLDDLVMPPPKNKVSAVPLSSGELGLLKLWIDQGAKGEVKTTPTEASWHPLPAHMKAIYATALTQDGQLAACGRANQIFVYHVPTQRSVTRLTDPTLLGDIYKKPGVAHRDSVQSLAFDVDGNLLASGGYRVVKLWRQPRNTRRVTLRAVSGDPVDGNAKKAPLGVTAVARSADGAWIATGTAHGAVQIRAAADVADDAKARTTAAVHADRVTAMVFLEDGKRLCSASRDGSIRFWTTASGAAAGRIDTPGPVEALALLDGEKQVVSGGPDGVVRVWGVPAVPAKVDGKAAKAPPADGKAENAAPAASLETGNPVTSLAAVPGAPQFLSGGDDGVVALWDVSTGKKVREMKHDAAVTAVAVRPDGQQFASADAGKTIRLWNPADGKQIAEMRGDYRLQLVTAEKVRQEKLFANRITTAKNALTAAEKDETAKTEAEKKAAEALAVAAKALAEKKTASEGAAATVKTLEKAAADLAAAAKAAKEDKKKAADAAAKQATDKLAAAKKAAEDAAKALKAADDAQKNAAKALATATTAHDAATEKVKTSKAAVATAQKAHEAPTKELEAAKKTAADSEHPVRTLAFSPDNLVLASGGDSKTVRTWSATDGKPFAVLEGHEGAVLSLVFAGNSALVSGGADHHAVIWDLNAPWKLERTIEMSDDASLFVDRVIALDFSRDSRFLATGGGEPSRSGELRVFKVEDGSTVWSLPDAHSDTIFAVEFSANGEYIASCGADKFVKVFSAADGKLFKSLEGHTHHVLGVSWRYDGEQLASCGADNHIRIWNVASGERSQNIGGFGKQVSAVRYIGDSPNTVSCSGDKLVRIHRTDNGKTVRDLSGSTDYMYSVAVSSDGAIITAGGFDGTLRVWNGNDGKPIHNFEPPATTTDTK